MESGRVLGAMREGADELPISGADWKSALPAGVPRGVARYSRGREGSSDFGNYEKVPLPVWRRRGSRMSRRASPNMFAAKTTTVSTAVGAISSQGPTNM